MSSELQGEPKSRERLLRESTKLVHRTFARERSMKTTAEGLVHLLEISILEIEQYAGPSFCNANISTTRDPKFNLVLFNTKTNDVEGCRLVYGTVLGSCIAK